ncbi:MAG: 50S ribosomal protein L6, partial [Promethearchaeia archaeon]
NVQVNENSIVTIEGPEGRTIEKDFSHARGIKISIEDDKLVFSANFPRSSTVSLANTIINIIKNIIDGVQTPYKYVCKICNSHFPFTVEVNEKKKELHVVNFLGEKAPRVVKYEPKLMDVEVDGDDVYLIGPDKELLGQVASNLKKVCHIKLKDPRIFQDGVYLFRKQWGNEVLWEIR